MLLIAAASNYPLLGSCTFSRWNCDANATLLFFCLTAGHRVDIALSLFTDLLSLLPPAQILCLCKKRQRQTSWILSRWQQAISVSCSACYSFVVFRTRCHGYANLPWRSSSRMWFSSSLQMMIISYVKKLKTSTTTGPKSDGIFAVLRHRCF